MYLREGSNFSEKKIMIILMLEVEFVEWSEISSQSHDQIHIGNAMIF